MKHTFITVAALAALLAAQGCRSHNHARVASESIAMARDSAVHTTDRRLDRLLTLSLSRRDATLWADSARLEVVAEGGGDTLRSQLYGLRLCRHTATAAVTDSVAAGAASSLSHVSDTLVHAADSTTSASTAPAASWQKWLGRLGALALAAWLLVAIARRRRS